MLDFIFKFIFDFILMYIFAYPGAFFVWILFNRKRTFKEVYQNDVYWNGLVGGIILGCMITALYFIFR